MIDLNKISPKFRQLVDVLLFSEKFSINISDFKSLVKTNRHVHLAYLLEKFKTSLEIFWENSPVIWQKRISFLFSLKDKAISKYISLFIEKRFFDYIKNEEKPNPKIHLELIQFIEYCKYFKNKKSKLSLLKQNILELINKTKYKKMIKIVESLIPHLFKDMNEFTALVAPKALNYIPYYEILKELEQNGYSYNKKIFTNYLVNCFFKPNGLFEPAIAFHLLNDADVRNKLKDHYNPNCKIHLLNYIDRCNLWHLEEKWLRNLKNIMEIDSSLPDEVFVIYINKVYSEMCFHKMTAFDRAMRFYQKFPQTSIKKILLHFSQEKKLPDINLLIKKYPELQKLSVFI